MTTDPRQSTEPPRPGARKRRRKRRGAKTGASPDKRRAAELATTDKAPKGPPSQQPEALAALEPSKIDTSRPADVPLSPQEVAEMQEHLRFLRQYRKVLRLRVNAAEDLLLNGAREPSHRGQCKHLLSKVDLSCIKSALTRVDTPRSRVRLLAGVVRFSSDEGVLILYLESLSEAESRAEAAAAFGLAVERIRFDEVSAARVRRILSLIATTFDADERVQVLFGLLGSRSFRDAFDRSAEELPEVLAELFVPLRAVHDVVFEKRENTFGEKALTRGVAILLGAPDRVLRSYPGAVRERLLRSAVRLVDDASVRDRATDVLLDSLSRKSRSYSQLGMDRARELLRAHQDERASKLLTQIASAQKDFELPGRWLTALESPRIGRMACIESADGQASGAPRSRLRRALWLDRQLPVWVRAGTQQDAARVQAEAEIQRELCVAGVVPLIASGLSDDGLPWVAMPAVGKPHDARRDRRRLAHNQALRFALGGVQILHALALLGVKLPDAEASRFLLTEGPSSLLLADFAGALRVSPEEASTAHRGLAGAWCRSLLRSLPRGAAFREVRQLMDAGAELPGLIRTLASAL